MAENSRYWSQKEAMTPHLSEVPIGCSRLLHEIYVSVRLGRPRVWLLSMGLVLNSPSHSCSGVEGDGHLGHSLTTC